LKVEEARAVLADQFPEIAVRTLTGPRSGTSNWCFLVNDEWIFRFPKDAESERELGCELMVLPALRTTSGVAFPSYEMLGRPSQRFPRRFVAYRNIPGEPLRRELLESLPVEDQERAARRIGGFLADLHDHPLDALRAAEREAGAELRRSPIEWFTNGGRDFRRKLNEKLYEHRHHPDFPRFRDLFRRLLDDPEIYQGEEAVVHGDLKAKHILYCEERREVTGFIDFGNVCLGDGFADFMHLADIYGMDFCHLVLQGYRRPTASLLGRKLRKAQLVLENLADFRRLIGLPSTS
jgi:aminoglycoside 2''-phosphotransferase